jgi:hypothetical protein
MFSRIRDRFGTAGLVVSVMALVLALAGGAFAASGLNSKQKSQVKAIAKQFAGKPGATGPAGSAGANGKDGASGQNGTDGADGTNGTDGANGKTVLSGSGAPAAGLGTNGDFYIDTDFQEIYGPKTGGGWGGPTSLQGRDGDPWSVGGTLPANATETGAWSAPANISTPAGVDSVPISFSVQLAGTLPEANVHLFSDTGTDPGGAFGDTCTGTADAPTAPSGHLCIYGMSVNPNVTVAVQNPVTFDKSATVAGTTLSVTFAGGFGFAGGTWAVTG